MHSTVAVLGGGASSEHEVSLVSASEVLNALSEVGVPTLAVWIDEDDRWHLVPTPKGTAESWSAGRLRRLGKEAPGRGAPQGVLELARLGADVVFPALHGKGGEDGHLQAVLEAGGLACVGSGRTASAIGMSKLQTRLAFTGVGLPMPRAWLPRRDEAQRIGGAELAQRVGEAGLRFPLFLKEDSCGSSLGVERIEAPEELGAALERVRALGDYWVLEEGVQGTEVTCAVLGNSGSELRPLPPVEIRPRQSAFFDYASKYDGEATEEICPPESLPAAVVERIQALAVAAHEVLGCRGFSRTDMMLAGNEPMLLETNTIPGLTPESLLPKAARAAGLSFPELVETLIDLAERRNERIVELPRPPRGASRLGAVHDVSPSLLHAQTLHDGPS